MFGSRIGHPIVTDMSRGFVSKWLSKPLTLEGLNKNVLCDTEASSY